jgi:hypothetical protein
MPRYNTSIANKTITGTTTIVTPDSGAFVQLAGTAPYTVTLPASAAFPGQEFTFHNTTSGTVTLSTPSGAFTGLGASGTATQALLPNTVTSVVSDGVNYVTLSEDGSVLFATDATITGNLTLNTAGTTATISPANLTINPSNTGSVNNVNIGASTRGSAAFTSLTANSAVTLTANTTSSGTSSGTLVVTGGVGVSGTVHAGAFNGPLTGTVTTAAQPNITSVGTLTGLTVTNTITGSVSGSASTAGTVTNAAQPNITSVGTLTSLTVTNTITGSVSGSASTAGTVTTAAQPNITSVGTLTGLTVSGDLSMTGTTAIKLPVGTTAQRPSSPVNGMMRKNSSTGYIEYWDPSSTSWKGIGVADGSSFNAAASSASSIKELTGTTVDGIYWINLPVLGPTQVYCDMNTDGGGWMMMAYAGSVSGVGNSSHIVFHTIGTIATSRSYGQTSFSRFDIARQISGASTNSRLMWRRTNDSNVIMIHNAGELFNRMPGGPSGSNMDMNGSGSGFPISYMKLSNTGPAGLSTKTNARYESGPSYPGIAWNSSYNDNRDGVGSITTFLNRRSLIYWETNGPQSNGQWFHASPLQMGPSSSPTTGQGRLDIEVYFRL